METRVRFVEGGLGGFRRVLETPADADGGGLVGRAAAAAAASRDAGGGSMRAALFAAQSAVVAAGLFAQGLLAGAAGLNLFMTCFLDAADASGVHENSGLLHYYSPIAVTCQRLYVRRRARGVGGRVLARRPERVRSAGLRAARGGFPGVPELLHGVSPVRRRGAVRGHAVLRQRARAELVGGGVGVERVPSAAQQVPRRQRAARRVRARRVRVRVRHRHASAAGRRAEGEELARGEGRGFSAVARGGWEARRRDRGGRLAGTGDVFPGVSNGGFGGSDRGPFGKSSRPDAATTTRVSISRNETRPYESLHALVPLLR